MTKYWAEAPGFVVVIEADELLGVSELRIGEGRLDRQVISLRSEQLSHLRFLLASPSLWREGDPPTPA